MNGIGLGGARALYLALLGLGFVVAAIRAQPEEMGVFAVASAYAGIFVVVLDFGLSRSVLRSFATGAGASLGELLRLRAPVVAILVVATLGVALEEPRLIGVIAVIAGRLALTDIESIAIARASSGSVAIATVVNAVASAGGLVLAATHGASAMLWASAVGNFVAIAMLVPAVGGDLTRGERSNLAWRDAWAFGLMSIVGVVYLRSSFAILPVMHIGASAIAAFALAFKSFELIAAMRGAVVQRQVVDLARADDPQHLANAAAARSAFYSMAVGMAGVLGAIGAAQVGLLGDYPHLWQMVACVAALVPMVMSHGVTSAWIYSRAGSVTVVWDSCVLSALAILLVTCAASFDTRAVVVVTCSMEYFSFLYFALRFRHSIALPVTRLVLPLVAVAPSGAIVAGAWGVLA